MNQTAQRSPIQNPASQRGVQKLFSGKVGISYKIMIAFTVILLLVAGIQIFVSSLTTRRNLEEEALHTLIGYQQTYQARINAESKASEALAISIAARDDVQRMYRDGNREELYKLLAPMFEEWKKRQIVHLYIENPDGTVFLRVHNPANFGDDITYRATASDALNGQIATSGIEIGPSRLGVRGVAPIYSSSTGKFIGMTEVGLDFDEDFITTLKEDTGADYTMWVTYDAAKIPALKPAENAPAAPIDAVFFYASSLPDGVLADPDVYRNVLETGEPAFRIIKNIETPSVVYIAPLLGYNNKVLGLLQVSEPYAENITAQNYSTMIAFGVVGSLTLVSLFLIYLLTKQLVLTPMNMLTLFAESQTKGEIKTRLSLHSGDEFETLASTFNFMADSVERERQTLEQRVNARTRNLELAGEVGRAVSQVGALDIMLRDACELILKEFSLYYVQVYLTDPSQTTLKLEAGTGNVGTQLLQRGHSLPFDISSINGRAAVEKHTVVISDTVQSATFRKNPLLPETRGEMAVPLIVANNVVGVLDMQSRESGALNEEVLPAFEALAGQLAVAIQNSNLLAETEQARAEVEKQARRLVYTSWSEHLDAIHQPETLGFMFDHDQISPLTDADESQFPENSKAVSSPISLMGESLGSLVVEIDDEAQRDQSSELVQIVARQVAQQIENLRLLESAERYRYEAEQAVRLQTRENWQAYFQSGSNNELSYLYDLNAVRPYNNGHETNENAYTLPLKVRDEAIGKLAVQGLGSDDHESIDLIHAVADRLTTHIEGLRQTNQTQSALAQSEKLFDVSRSLTQATDLQQLVNTTVATLKIPEINRAILVAFNYNESDSVDSLDVIANWWNGTGHQATAIGTHYPLEVIRVMQMFISPTPVFFDDTFTDERVDATTMQLVQRLNLRAVAVLPLHVGTGQIGALILEAEVTHAFTPEETRLFTAIAPQIATIVDNRRQFERAQKQAEREAMLNVINQKIQSATSVEAVLQIAARELGHALGAPMTIAQLSMKDKSS